jgi:hypothetical protein
MVASVVAISSAFCRNSTALRRKMRIDYRPVGGIKSTHA